MTRTEAGQPLGLGSTEGLGPLPAPDLQADATATLKEQAAEIQHLRQLLAVRVAGALLYADDGELQDNTQHPCIDFRRDTPSEIQRKLQERGLANYRRSLEDEARGFGA